MIVDVPKADGSTQRQVGSPFKFSQTPPAYQQVGGQAGAEATAVLQEIGYTDDEINKMRQQGVFG